MWHVEPLVVTCELSFAACGWYLVTRPVITLSSPALRKWSLGHQKSPLKSIFEAVLYEALTQKEIELWLETTEFLVPKYHHHQLSKKDAPNSQKELHGETETDLTLQERRDLVGGGVYFPKSKSSRNWEY